MGLEPARWREIAIGLRVVSLVSAAPPSSQGDPDSPSREIPDSGDLSPDLLATRSQLKSTLATAVRKLPARYQTVIRMYYLADRTLREIVSTSASRKAASASFIGLRSNASPRNSEPPESSPATRSGDNCRPQIK
jgi:DNA-directed RNA polymerase sigma subunit (sigma70/sigma32)